MSFKRVIKKISPPIFIKLINNRFLILHKMKRSAGLINIDKLILRSPLSLHLGCGLEYWKGWVNIDISSSSVADVVMDFVELKHTFKRGTVDDIAMIHSISYLRLWEAQEFFKDAYFLLKPGGHFVLEFPDITKCALHILQNENNVDNYLEGVRAFYAFDLLQIKNKEKFNTYAFGWSAWHIKQELLSAGFSSVEIKDPETHNKLKWRDTRIESIK